MPEIFGLICEKIFGMHNTSRNKFLHYFLKPFQYKFLKFV